MRKTDSPTEATPPVISSASFVPWWRVRATWKATGAARKPSIPINGARKIEETVVPSAIPVQTITAQEIFCTEAATISPSPGISPELAAKRSSKASIPRPSRTESHATRRRITPRLKLLAVELVVVSAAIRPDLFINRSSLPSTASLFD